MTILSYSIILALLLDFIFAVAILKGKPDLKITIPGYGVFLLVTEIKKSRTK